MTDNKPDIILRRIIKEKWCKLIEVSVPAEKRWSKKETKVEIVRMGGGVKTETIPVIVGASLEDMHVTSSGNNAA